jgi:hypothetical protein
MIIRDSEGEIDLRMGERFRCKLDDRPALLMEIVHPYINRPGPPVLCCRVVEGLLRDDNGVDHGPGAIGDLPAHRVAAAVRRYRARTHSSK